jgi:hypothetical protein
MIIATKKRQVWGDPGKGQSRFNIYAQFNFSTDSDITELGLRAGDVIEANVDMIVSDVDELNRQVNNWIVSCTKRMNEQIAWANNPEQLPRIMDPSEYSPATPAEPDPVQIAQQEYNQKRMTLITAKQDLEVELITAEEYAAIQAEAQTAKAAVSTAVNVKLHE